MSIDALPLLRALETRKDLALLIPFLLKAHSQSVHSHAFLKLQIKGDLEMHDYEHFANDLLKERELAELSPFAKGLSSANSLSFKRSFAKCS